MRIYLLLLTALLLTGCAESFDESRMTKSAPTPAAAAKLAALGSALDNRHSVVDSSKSTGSTDGAATAIQAGETGEDRKIIYVAEVSLVVEEFSAAETQVTELVKQHKGYVSNVSVDRTSGDRRFGRWVARIPVAQFDPFLAALGQVGFPENRQQTAQDVTEEYVDLTARLTNNKRLEERIVKLLDDRTGEIKDVIEVERELARVRGEIEQLEGRLRYLSNRTEFTTVTINVREERDYQAPEAPSFGDRVQLGWTNSLWSLREAAENTAVNTIAAAPWIAVWGVPILVVLVLLRRWWRRGRAVRVT